MPCGACHNRKATHYVCPGISVLHVHAQPEVSRLAPGGWQGTYEALQLLVPQFTARPVSGEGGGDLEAWLQVLLHVQRHMVLLLPPPPPLLSHLSQIIGTPTLSAAP